MTRVAFLSTSLCPLVVLVACSTRSDGVLEPSPTQDAMRGDAANADDDAMPDAAPDVADRDVDWPDGSADVPDVQTLETDAGRAARLLTPVAPTATTFMWQSLQTDFYDVVNDRPCKGRVTLALADRVICYTASTDSLLCAGAIYTTVYGDRFVDAGQTAVDQIILSQSTIADGNDIWIHRTDKKVFAFGGENGGGQLGTGMNYPVATWTAWGGGADFERIATAGGYDLCGVDATGAITCSGYVAGPPPTGQPFSTLWLDDYGAVHTDNAAWRSPTGQCTISSVGLICKNPMVVPAPRLPTTGVVDGAFIEDVAPMRDRMCVLTDNGKLSCAEWNTPTSPMDVPPVTYRHLFARAGGILAFAAERSGSAICAVAEDASLWCIGENASGHFGTGDAIDLAMETQVQPPGSVKVDCP